MGWGAVAVGVGALVGGVMSASASKSAAKSQSAASQYASDVQYASAQLAADAQLAAADKSARAVRDAAAISAKTQMDMYNRTRADQLPWLRSGKKALTTLNKKVASGPGKFKADPGYQFRLSEGNKNILANAAATGGLASGRTLKAIQEYGQEYASNEYDKFLNRYHQSLAPLQSLAGVGQATATNLATQGNQLASNIAQNEQAMGTNLANIYTNSGIAQASGYTDSGNIQANNFIAQGDIAARSTINQANAWTSALNTGVSGLASYYGSKPSAGGMVAGGMTPGSSTQIVRY